MEQKCSEKQCFFDLTLQKHSKTNGGGQQQEPETELKPEPEAEPASQWHGYRSNSYRWQPLPPAQSCPAVAKTDAFKTPKPVK